MSTPFTHEDLARYVLDLRIWPKWFTIEHVMSATGAGRKDVQRAIQKLRVQPGWSIQTSNRLPENAMYGQRRRGWALGRNLKKRSRFVDFHGWRPTVYAVERHP